MKVAVYAIAKNEAANVEGWAASAADADVRLIVDTGSTDRTVTLADAFGVTVERVVVDPWRFDAARNHALALLPDDIDWCIALDLDERLQPGWRADLEGVADNVTRPRYPYTWSWNADGTPGLVYGGDKIHRRHGFTWKHPVHETLVYDGVETGEWVDLQIHHHPDDTKPRSSYLPLLALAVAEDPDDDRNAHYYARELMYAGRDLDAVVEFSRHLALPSATWAPERAWSMRYLARCVSEHEREAWLLRACAEAPGYREPWVDLAMLRYQRGEWASCLGAARRALSIEQRPLEYLTEADAWGAVPHDLAAIACANLGLRDEALEYGRAALVFAPDDERLIRNVGFYEAARCG